MIGRFHDSLFAGHLGFSRTAYRLLDRVYWPVLRQDVCTYLASCAVCLARKSPCPRRAPRLWDMSTWATDGIGWLWILSTCQLQPRKATGTSWLWWTVFLDGRKLARCLIRRLWLMLSFSILCAGSISRLGPSVIHSDQGREFEKNLMQELCLLCGAHKTRTTPYHPVRDGLVERFNRTWLMMLAMFVGENRDDWDDLLPAVMMAYSSSVHESTGFSPYRLMFGGRMYIAYGRRSSASGYGPAGTPITNPYAIWVRDALEVAYTDQVRRHSGQAVLRQKRLYDKRAVRRLFAVGDWAMRYYSPAKKCKLDSA